METPKFDWITKKISPELAIAHGFNRLTWDAYTGIVEIDSNEVITGVLHYEKTPFSFSSNNQSHINFLKDIA